MISGSQWADYEREGSLHLGQVLSDADLAALQGRIDEIMLGTAQVPYDRMLMQLDSASGKYDDVGEQSNGFKGATLSYRKIQDLELDPLYMAYVQRPLFREICEHVYGRGTAIASFRAMFMNKPARQGTFLPWHQDRWSNLDRDPLITIWTALDPATVENGCVQVVPGTHKAGVMNPAHGSGFLTPEQTAERTASGNIKFLELKAGEAVLLHNWLLHSSDVNKTDHPRRAFSVCYMDARTRTTSGAGFRVVFEG